MLRFALLLIGLTTLASSAQAGEKFAGLLTFGCGDRYLTRPGATQTWAVNMSPAQHREMVHATGGAPYFAHEPWVTLFVEFIARKRPTPKRGFFGEHVGQLDVEYLIGARFLNEGESIDATATQRPITGVLLLTYEAAGFVPRANPGEYWWLVQGNGQPLDALLTKVARLEPTLIKITARTGPPGAYGHTNRFDREAAVDNLKYIRRADVSELRDSAMVQENPRTPEFDRCIRER